MAPKFHKPPRAARFTLLSIAIAALAATGCASMQASPDPVVKKPKGPTPPTDVPPVPERNEIVLETGTKVTATTAAGEITIIAGPGLLRTIKWDGATRWAVMKPRKERYAGSLGIYYHGTPPDWKPHQGLTRLNYEEGQLHFETLRDAKIWMQIRRLHFVYTDTGLVIGWKREFKDDTLTVEVWQFYISGEKPTDMPGAEGRQIALTQVPVPVQTASRSDK